MILINLLPKELRVSTTQKANVPYRPIAIGIFIVFVLLGFYNLFISFRLRAQLRGLEEQWSGMAQDSAQAEALEREFGATILAEVDFYDAWVDPPLQAGRVLNTVSDLLPKSLWLTQLVFQRGGKEMQLVLDGLSKSTGRDSKLVEIQTLANQLKSEIEPILGPGAQINLNPAFKKQLLVAVTTSSKDEDQEQSEVTQFTTTLKTDGFSEEGQS